MDAGEVYYNNNKIKKSFIDLTLNFQLSKSMYDIE